MKQPSTRVNENMISGLSHMAEMPNYMAWIIASFSRHIRGNIVEVGAGIGSYIPLYQRYADHISVVEPTPDFVLHLEKAYPDVDVIKSTVESLPDRFQGTFDTVICINALEHFKHDAEAIANMAALLSSGGKLCVYVPARPELFGDWDRSVGHYRRYDAKALEKRMQQAGLQVLDMRYSDPLGGAAWYLSGKLGATPSENESSLSWSMRIFDKFCVPIQKTVEQLLTPPWGKSLICIATHK